MNMSKVSLIIPIYNLEETLKRCLDSVVSQTYKNLEIILVDDGSIDKSKDICLEYKDQDGRIKYFYHDNHGVSYTRNKGIANATGEYLMFLDGDDWFAVDMVENYLIAATEYSADVVIGGMQVYSENVMIAEKKPPVLGTFGLDVWNIICAETEGIFGYVPNKMYRTEIIKKDNINFDVSMYAQEDLDFALSVYSKCSNFYFIDFTGYYYQYSPGKRQHPYEMYIKNCLKMLRLASEKCELEESNRNAIIQRICGLIYVSLYEVNKDDFYKKFMQCYEIDDLVNVLANRKSKVSWEIKQFCKKRIGLLKVYFVLRKRISKALHKNL